MYRLTKEYVRNAISSTYKDTNNNIKKRIDINGGQNAKHTQRNIRPNKQRQKEPQKELFEYSQSTTD